MRALVQSAVCAAILFLAAVLTPAAAAQEDLPKNAEPAWNGGWQCKRNYQRVGSECMFIKLPDNAQLDWTGHAWECRRGFRRVGDGCASVKIPDNAELDWTGHASECRRGFRRLGDNCTEVNLPANAELDWTGHSWKCQAGFRLKDKRCEPFRVPLHARLALGGNDFLCDLNFKRAGETCVPMSEQEIVMQNLLIMQARACGDTKTVDVSGDCGGYSVSGELDVCSKSRDVNGSVTYDNGMESDFDGEWTSPSEIEGTDSFGNSCDLEID